MRTVLTEIVSLIVARQNCENMVNSEMEQRHFRELERIAKELLPSGSGIDCGTKIDIDASSRDKIVLHTSFHHMNDNGMYDGWTEHDIIITADLLSGFNLRITGRDRNQIKEYLHEVFSTDLSAEYQPKEVAS